MAGLRVDFFPSPLPTALQGPSHFCSSHESLCVFDVLQRGRVGERDWSGTFGSGVTSGLTGLGRAIGPARVWWRGGVVKRGWVGWGGGR